MSPSGLPIEQVLGEYILTFLAARSREADLLFPQAPGIATENRGAHASVSFPEYPGPNR